MVILKLITFDFTGTIMRFRQPPHIQYLKMFQSHGIVLKDTACLADNLKTAYKTANADFPNFGARNNMDWREWWKTVVKHTLIQSGVEESADLNILAFQLIDFYSSMEAWEVTPGIESLLDALKANGKKMGIISNMDPRIHNLLQQSNLNKYFDFILASYEVDCCKPQQEIFGKAFSKIGLPLEAKECCHIGDSYNEDFVGALSCGWEAILIANKKFMSSRKPGLYSKIEDLKSHLLGTKLSEL